MILSFHCVTLALLGASSTSAGRYSSVNNVEQQRSQFQNRQQQQQQQQRAGVIPGRVSTTPTRTSTRREPVSTGPQTGADEWVDPSLSREEDSPNVNVNVHDNDKLNDEMDPFYIQAPTKHEFAVGSTGNTNNLADENQQAAAAETQTTAEAESIEKMILGIESSPQSQATAGDDDKNSNVDDNLSVATEFDSYLKYLQLAPQSSVLNSYEFKVDSDIKAMSKILNEPLFDLCTVSKCLDQGDDSKMYKPERAEARNIFSVGKYARTVSTIEADMPKERIPFTIPGSAKFTANVNGNFVTATIYEQTDVTTSPFSLKLVYDKKSYQEGSCIPNDAKFSVAQTEGCLADEGFMVLELPDDMKTVIRFHYKQEQESSPSVMTEGSIELMNKAIINDYVLMNRAHAVNSHFFSHMFSYHSTYGSPDAIANIIQRIMHQPLPKTVSETSRDNDHSLQFTLDDIPFETLPDDKIKSYVIERLIDLNILTSAMMHHSEMSLSQCQKSLDEENYTQEQRQQFMLQSKQLYERVGALFSGSQLRADYEKNGASVFKVYEQEAQNWGTTSLIIENEHGHQIKAAKVNQEWIDQFMSGLETFDNPPESMCSFKPQIEEMNRLMNIPIFQGVLRVATMFKNKPERYWTMQDRADALIYAITVLPIIEASCGLNCDTTPITKMMQVFDIASLKFDSKEPYVQPKITYKSIREIGVVFEQVRDLVESSMLTLRISCTDLGVKTHVGSTCDYTNMIFPKKQFLGYSIYPDDELRTNFFFDVLRIYEVIDRAEVVDRSTNMCRPTPPLPDEMEVYTTYAFGRFTAQGKLLIRHNQQNLEPREFVIPKGTKLMAKTSEGHDITAYVTEECPLDCYVLHIVYDQNDPSLCILDEDLANFPESARSNDPSYEAASEGCIYFPEYGDDPDLQVSFVDEFGELQGATVDIMDSKNWNGFSTFQYSYVTDSIWNEFEGANVEEFEDKSIYRRMADYWKGIMPEANNGSHPCGDSFLRFMESQSFANYMFINLFDLTNLKYGFQSLQNEISVVVAKKIILTANLLPAALTDLHLAALLDDSIENSLHLLDGCVTLLLGSASIDGFEGSASIYEYFDQIAERIHKTYVAMEQEAQETQGFESQFKLRYDPFETTFVAPAPDSKESPVVESLIFKKIMAELVKMQDTLNRSNELTLSEMRDALVGSAHMVEQYVYAAFYQETIFYSALSENFVQRMPHDQQFELEASSIALSYVIGPLHYGINRVIDSVSLYDVDDFTQGYLSLLDWKFYGDQFSKTRSLIAKSMSHTIDSDKIDKFNQLIYTIIVDDKEINFEEQIIRAAPQPSDSLH